MFAHVGAREVMYKADEVYVSTMVRHVPLDLSYIDTTRPIWADSTGTFLYWQNLGPIGQVRPPVLIFLKNKIDGCLLLLLHFLLKTFLLN